MLVMKYILFSLPVIVVYGEQVYQNYRRNENKNIVSTNAISIQRKRIEDTRICLHECTKNRFCTAAAISKTTKTCKLMPDLILESGQLVNDNEWDLYEGIYENVAIGKTTWQSSTHVTHDGLAGNSYHAVDNKFGTNFYGSSSCTNTRKDGFPWWIVDLGAPRLIHTVRLLNRADCCADRLSDVLVTIGDVQSNMEICGKHIPAVGAGETLTLKCRNGMMTGRYVKVQLQKIDILALCEVSVMARV